MAKLILFGAGRGADVAFRYLSRDSDYEICGFTVDKAYLRNAEFHGLPVVPFDEVEIHFPPSRYLMLVLIGYQDMNGLRARKYLEAKRKGYSFASYVCSDVFQADTLQVGENCFIIENQSISLDVKIGNNVVMWASNHIGDLTVIGDHVWVSSHVSVAANVTMENFSFLGLGATISNHVKLGERSFIGANALISSDTAADSVWVAGQSKTIPADSRTFMKVLQADQKL